MFLLKTERNFYIELKEIKSLFFFFFPEKLQHCPQDLFYFYFCITLLSTILSCSVRANPIPSSSSSTIKVSEMPFSEKLSNPCTLLNASSLHRSQLPPETRESNRRDMVNLMNARSELLKDTAETILQTVSVLHYLVSDFYFYFLRLKY